ncbi:MAG: chorismate mutase [Alkalilacustris sp.]
MTGKAPEDCRDMAELRALIDALDAELVARLALRARCIDRAAEIKREVGLPARIPARVEDVVAKVRQRAEVETLDPDLVESLWRRLIEWSIAREEATLGTGDGHTD